MYEKPQKYANANMNSATDEEMPVPRDGILVTHLLIVADVARSKNFYSEILGAHVVLDGAPTILRFFNTWLVLSPEGDPADDRPGVAARAPCNANVLTSALNLRVPDVTAVYEQWLRRGAEFLTPPKRRSSEIRCYLRDPDGHLIEVGQTLGAEE